MKLFLDKSLGGGPYPANGEGPFGRPVPFGSLFIGGLYEKIQTVPSRWVYAISDVESEIVGERFVHYSGTSVVNHPSLLVQAERRELQLLRCLLLDEFWTPSIDNALDTLPCTMRSTCRRWDPVHCIM